MKDLPRSVRRKRGRHTSFCSPQLHCGAPTAGAEGGDRCSRFRSGMWFFSPALFTLAVKHALGVFSVYCFNFLMKDCKYFRLWKEIH